MPQSWVSWFNALTTVKFLLYVITVFDDTLVLEYFSPHHFMTRPEILLKWRTFRYELSVDAGDRRFDSKILFVLRHCDFLAQYQKQKRKFASYCEISTALNWLKHLIDYFRFFFPFLLSLRVHTNFEKSICHLLRSLVPIHSKGCLNCGNIETQSSTFGKSGNVATYDYKHQFSKLERILRANDPFVHCCFKHLRYVKRGRIFVPCYDVIFVYPQKILVFHFATLVVFVPKIIDFWTTLFLPFETRSWEFTLDRAVVFETRCLLPKYCKSRRLSLPGICKRL